MSCSKQELNEREKNPHYLKSFKLKANHKLVEVEYNVEKVVDVVLLTIVGVETVVVDVVPLTDVGVGTGVIVVVVVLVDVNDVIVAVVVVILVVADVVSVVVSLVADVLPTQSR